MDDRVPETCQGSFWGHVGRLWGFRIGLESLGSVVLMGYREFRVWGLVSLSPRHFRDAGRSVGTVFWG